VQLHNHGWLRQAGALLCLCIVALCEAGPSRAASGPNFDLFINQPVAVAALSPMSKLVDVAHESKDKRSCKRRSESVFVEPLITRPQVVDLVDALLRIGRLFATGLLVRESDIQCSNRCGGIPAISDLDSFKEDLVSTKLHISGPRLSKNPRSISCYQLTLSSLPKSVGRPAQPIGGRPQAYREDGDNYSGNRDDQFMVGVERLRAAPKNGRGAEGWFLLIASSGAIGGALLYALLVCWRG
jgi:hypothetical protein